MDAETQVATRTEWAVKHAQGVYTGPSYRPLTERDAREWAKSDVAQDSRRQASARGSTQVIRREVTEWVPAD